ncbi:MAG: peptidase inhibitor I42 [Acetobacteraceae bacterium]|nr:peptidase inhibitor I42 [Acetobacteraceae bacterium]
MLAIDEAFAGQTVSIPVGQVIELRLKENPTTGFRWLFRQDGAPACRIKEDFLETAGETPPPRPGQGATHVWRIEAVKAGVCDLALTLGRPWESSLPPAGQFDVRINVTT